MLKYISLSIVLFLSCLCISCNNEITESLDAMKGITKITIPPINASQGRVKTIPFEKYFKSWKLIQLETSKEYLIGTTDRIVHYKDMFYVLDKRSDCVYVFDSNGKGVMKLSNIGQGPGEWLALMDFTIDRKQEQIILHSDRPYKLLYFTMDGKFIRETEIDDFYRNIAWSDNKLYFSNSSFTLKHKVFSTPVDLQKMVGFLPLKQDEALFENSGLLYPNLVNSKSLYFTLSYSNIVYECKSSTVIPKYGLDFGRKNIPSDFYKNGRSASQLFSDSYKNDYGFAIANFKECDNYIMFSYAGNIMVIYDKKTKKAESGTLIENTRGKVNFQNFFANDGDDNSVLEFYNTTFFLKQMDLYKDSPVTWLQVPDYVKKIYATTTKSSNPLLLVYNFK